MVLRRLSQTLRITLALMVATFSSGLLQPAVAYATDDIDPTPGNNGTVKVHEKGTLSGTESNDPKVCVFNFEGFGFDVGQEGRIDIAPQGGDSETTDTASFVFGPADANGYYATAYLNDGVQSLDNGHYKSTLFGKDTNGGYTIELKAKSKNFKVECAPVVVPPAGTLTVNVTCEAGSFSGVVTGPINGNPTYTVNGDVTQPGSFTGLTPGSYTIVMYVNGTEVDRETVTVPACVVLATTIPKPTIPTTDLCGPANIAFGAIPTSENYTFVNNTTSVTFTAKAGFVFAGGSPTVTVTLPNDTNVACPAVLPCVTTTGPEKISKDTDFADYQDTRAAGHYTFLNNGLRIYTDNNSSLAKVAWYNNVDYSLANIGVPSMDYTATNGPAPGLQIVIDFDGNGTTDGILIGEAVYGDKYWLSNSSAQFVKDGAPNNGGGYGSAYYGTLNEWLAKFPTAQVDAVGFSLGSGVLADGVLKSLTFGCHTWVFEKKVTPVTTCPVVYGKNHSTNISKNGWTVPVGAEYVDGGIKLTVPGNWDEVSISRAISGALANIGTGVTFTPGTQYLGIHVETSNGTLVYEQEPSYAGKWWSNSDFNVASGMGYQTFDTLENIVDANPGVTLMSMKVLYTSPTASTTTVTSVKFGCVEYTFDKADTPGQGGGTPVTPVTPTTPTTPGQTLGTSTTTAPVVTAIQNAVLPAVLPATGGIDSPFMILVASMLAFGATYFLQGKRLLGRRVAVEA